MRHQVRGRKLGRTSSHRKATLEALSNALIRNERITTTLPKAKELRRFVEPLITRSKVDNLLNRRIVFSALRDKETVKKIFEEVGPLVADRPGGYTRIVKVGNRSGDGAPVAIIELVDYNDSKPETAGKKKKRTRRGSGKAAVSAETPAKEKTDAKKASKKSDAAPDVKAEDAAPVAEQPGEVADVEAIETVDTDEATDKASEAKTEASEVTAADEAKEEAKAEAIKDTAAAKAKEETKAEAAKETAAEEAKEEAKAEAAEETAAEEVKEETKAEAAEETAAEEAKEETKAETDKKKADAGDDTEAKADSGSDTQASADDKKADDDKKKTD
jgi:large subunit ribosomal protein L17